MLHEALAWLPRGMELRERYFPQALLGLAGLWLLLALARRGDGFGAVVSGIKTKTTETNQALETLAMQIRTDPALRDLFAHNEARGLRSALEVSQDGRTFLERFEVFLAQYGHRETESKVPGRAILGCTLTYLGEAFFMGTSVTYALRSP